MLAGLLASVSAVTVSPSPEPELQHNRAATNLTVNDLLSTQDYEKTDLSPGIPPEGDYMGWAAFTADGAKIWFTNRQTGNVTVFDWATMAVDTNIPVGPYIGGIALTDTYAIVTVPFVDSIVILRLSDYSVAARLPSGQQPWTVRVSPDRRRAYVACDISNTCEVYDLQSLTRVSTIANFPVSLSTITWNSENGRTSWTFINFVISGDGSEIAVSNRDDTLFWFDCSTGACVDTLAGIGDCPVLDLSGDRSKLIAGSYATPSIVRRFDMATHTLLDSVVLTGYGLGWFDCAVNMDGSKAFISTSNNTSAMVRFATLDFKTFTQTYSAFWSGPCENNTRAISGQYRFSLIDFALDSLLSQHQGNTQSVGAVWAAGSRAVGFDPHRHEGLHFYDVSGGTVAYRGTTNAGLDPEGDCPHRLAIAPDGSKAVVANVLSDNVTIIDLATGTIDTIIPAGDRPQELAITSDSRWAVVASVGSDCVTIIDLLSSTAAAVVTTGSGPWPLVISADDSFAYTGDLSSNTVTVIRLDGANSSVVATIPVGEIGVVWGNYGVASGLAISPDRNWLLVAGSFDDRVLVIDARTYTVVDTLAVGDFPLRFAFNATGTHATVSNYLGNTFSVLRVCGDSSSVVATTGCGQYPLGVSYDPVHDHVGIGTYAGKSVVLINPENGVVISTLSYSSYGSLSDVRFDEAGNPVVLTQSSGNVPGHLHRGADHIQLPAVPKSLDYCPATQTAVAAMPGPDWVSIIDFSQQSVSVTSPAPRPLAFSISPNPCRGLLTVQSTIEGRQSEILIVDVSGRIVRRSPFATRHSPLLLDLRSLPPGLYFLRLTSGPTSATTSLIITN
jgi:YVTN family beta-propeller protein